MDSLSVPWAEQRELNAAKVSDSPAPDLLNTNSMGGGLARNQVALR